MQQLASVPCPNCSSPEYQFATDENGYDLVKCVACRFLYVNPRPPLDAIDEAAKTGMHATERGSLEVVGRFDRRKVAFYSRRLVELFGIEFLQTPELSWLDIGAGYGELVAAVSGFEGEKGDVVGLEPCLPKEQNARARGLDVRSSSLDSIDGPYDVVSMINVFSHLPDPREFLRDVARLVSPGGSLMLVTGNGADLPVRELPRRARRSSGPPRHGRGRRPRRRPG